MCLALIACVQVFYLREVYLAFPPGLVAEYILSAVSELLYTCAEILPIGCSDGVKQGYGLLISKMPRQRLVYIDI